MEHVTGRGGWAGGGGAGGVAEGGAEGITEGLAEGRRGRRKLVADERGVNRRDQPQRIQRLLLFVQLQRQYLY